MPWLRANRHLYKQLVVEAKEVKVSICDTDFEPQQLPSLRLADSDTGISFKIPDGSGIFTPFDCISISNAKALVAIMFRDVGWCLIDIKDWDRKPKEHLNWDDAKSISDYYYLL